jgi:RNase P subunit RPR2
MARTYLVFGDIEGKLDMLRVECTRCGRKGRYSIRKLIEKYERK